MPLSYSVDPTAGIVTISGDYAGVEEWMRLLTTIAVDPHCPRGCAYLRDLRDGTVPTDAATVASVMESIGKAWQAVKPRRAAILTREEDRITAQVTGALADAQKLPIRAFTSYEDAMTWLREAPPPPDEMS